MRSHREEAVLSRLSRRIGLQLRNAGLRSPLCLLPELGHLAGVCAIPEAESPPLQASPEALVQDAISQGAKVLVSTYNEPLITSEWAVAVFKEARAAGLRTGFVSNGNGTPQVLEYIRPWVDLYKVDLKSFDDRHYHQLGGRIGPILETIRRLHEMGTLARGRDPADSWIQRLGRRTEGADGFSGQRFTLYSLACNRIS